MYGTVQLQGNVCTCPRCDLHAFWMHTTSGKKGVVVTLSLAAALSQGFTFAWTHLVHVTDVSRTRSINVLYALQMRAILPWN